MKKTNISDWLTAIGLTLLIMLAPAVIDFIIYLEEAIVRALF